MANHKRFLDLFTAGWYKIFKHISKKRDVQKLDKKQSRFQMCRSKIVLCVV
jgi:hypothetical protein